eukprot:364988-Chlamydomonas_euryale.AAC.5
MRGRGWRGTGGGPVCVEVGERNRCGTPPLAWSVRTRWKCWRGTCGGPGNAGRGGAGLQRCDMCKPARRCASQRMDGRMDGA